MATDNRHRPGPPFRCPDCKMGNAHIVARPDQPTRGRRVAVECGWCGRAWLSKHKRARWLLADQKPKSRKRAKVTA